MEREIVYMPLEELIPYENNPRNNDDAVPYVMESIKEFGFKVPIIIDAADTIVAGHTRYKAAKKLGLTEVPVIRVEDLSSEQIQAFRIIDNKSQELAKWDFDKLDEELARIRNFDAIDAELAKRMQPIDMSRFGFMEYTEEGEFSRVQDLDDGTELSIEEFADENFNCECPICGFRFNEGGGSDE